MKGRSHIYGGVCAGLVTSFLIYKSSFFSSSSIAISCCVATSIIASILPDIDATNSTISIALRPLHYLVNAFLLLLKGIMWLLLHLAFWMTKKKKKEILSTFEHRGILHSIPMTVFLTFLVGLLFLKTNYCLAIVSGFFAGYSTHLLMDMLTVSGIKLFLPFSTHVFHYPKIRLHTGGFLDELVGCLIVTLITLLLMIVIYIVYF